MVHSDCGAYGGLAGGFGGDAAAEAEHHERELRRAAANLRAAIPGIEVQGYFVDFEGIWDAEIGPRRIPWHGSLMPKFEKHIFVCGNQRPAGHPRGCCDPKAEARLQKLFKQKLAERGLNGQSACQPSRMPRSMRTWAERRGLSRGRLVRTCHRSRRG